MPDEFSRMRLLLGADAVDGLSRAAVAVFGVGGVGSFTAEALARSGVGRLTIVDDDKVCLTNINRQLIALHSTIGKKKVEVMKARVLDINPKCDVTAKELFYCAQTYDEIDLSGFDYIVDAVDTVSAKLELAARAFRAGVPIISCMGAGNKLDPSRFEVADIYETSVCPLARVMRRELKKRGIPRLKVVYSKEEPISPGGGACEEGCVCPPGTARKCAAKRQIPGSVAFVPSAAGLIIAGEIIRDLTSGRAARL